MFQYGLVAGSLNIKHQHSDGSWADMEARDAHDPADSDEERDWQRGHVYVCTRCDETIAVAPPEGEADAPSAG
ncbi:MAG TPA: hypothetical protein VFM38_01830 [Candidatus Limnocylindrales bacterium]|jgi:hypothetical protein|nr:hypothetical protein [Candidatus Limnocylindrales bacterium]